MRTPVVDFLSSVLTPVHVDGVGTGVVQVVAADWGTCARKQDGSLWCWGDDSFGTLADGMIGPGSASPVQIALAGNVVDVSIGNYHASAVLADRTVWSWGGNGYGEIGDGTTDGTPCDFAGTNHHCRLTPVQSLLCATAAGDGGDASGD
jgi:alpha-tubulin suppressor-like RCC1 family protein